MRCSSIMAWLFAVREPECCCGILHRLFPDCGFSVLVSFSSFRNNAIVLTRCWWIFLAVGSHVGRFLARNVEAEACMFQSRPCDTTSWHCWWISSELNVVSRTLQAIQMGADADDAWPSECLVVRNVRVVHPSTG